MINPVLAAMIVVNAAGAGFTAYLLHLTKGALQSAKEESLSSRQYAAAAQASHNQALNRVAETHQIAIDVAANLASAAQFAADAGSKRDRAREYAERAFESQKHAELHADTAKDHSDTAALEASAAFSHARVASEYAETSELHAEKSEDHAKHSGFISNAVTVAAQAAAATAQKRQAECSACHRAVNSYMLREDGRVVCKWCSNRNRG